MKRSKMGAAGVLAIALACSAAAEEPRGGAGGDPSRAAEDAAIRDRIAAETEKVDAALARTRDEAARAQGAASRAAATAERARTTR